MTGIIGIFVILGAFTFFLGLTILVDFENFKWVYQKLRKPLKEFKTNAENQDNNGVLTGLSIKYLDLYNGYSVDHLKDLETELSMKRIKYTENLQFSSYLGSMLALLAVLIAVFTVASEYYPMETLIIFVFYSLLLLAIVTAYMMGDLTTRLFNGNLIEKHLFTVQKVIIEKEKSINISAAKIQENKILREKRLNRLRKKKTAK
ncbi:hypothetical protein [Paenibacillus sp. OK076]|uniref:hypothetical protein n=1 Tax=Paenibacillus sp. OK076 TaxID=1884379 RepID=UPI0008B6C527|nr:hypothetical protein [Paenibacillus sp. OK076]SEO11539.1 hypothetical protein SAMN05518670_3664 [Paenibacillus sp. OK076]